MQQSRVSVVCLPLVLFLFACIASAQTTTTINWSGYEWSLRSGTGGPGPNSWNANNVFVDANGYLHLQINNQSGTWSSAELDMITPATLGFGTFQFHELGRPDLLDPNTVFGFFTYPPSSVGPDSTNEIDIEFSRWGNANAYNGNYTVWPTSLTANRSWYGFNIQQPANNESTHRFVWTPNTVSFQSFDGFRDVSDNSSPYASWVFDPVNPPNPTETGNYQFYCSSHSTTACISQNPQYFIINLWQYAGQVPTSGATQEVVLTDFQYVPMGTTTPAVTPVFSVAPGTYSSAQTVALSDATPGATIYYTTDGSTPTTSSTVYSAPIQISATTTIHAMAAASGYANSAVASGTYTISQSSATTSTPVFSVASGTYTSALSVGISDSTTGATIYYTTDGSTPTASSPAYSAPIQVPATMTIHAIAAASGYLNSAVASAMYTINSSSSGSCYTAWNANTIYNTGNQVSYNNVNYQANFWTEGDNPAVHSGPAGSGQPWLTLGSCSSGSSSTPPPNTGTCFAAWSASTVYNTGNQVSYADVNYQANYWTQGNNPSTNNGAAGSGQPWQSLGACSNSSTSSAILQKTVKLAKSRSVPSF